MCARVIRLEFPRAFTTRSSRRSDRACTRSTCTFRPGRSYQARAASPYRRADRKAPQHRQHHGSTPSLRHPCRAESLHVKRSAVRDRSLRVARKHQRRIDPNPSHHLRPASRAATRLSSCVLSFLVCRLALSARHTTTGATRICSQGWLGLLHAGRPWVAQAERQGTCLPLVRTQATRRRRAGAGAGIQQRKRLHPRP
jgi:hypothetical protein